VRIEHRHAAVSHPQGSDSMYDSPCMARFSLVPKNTKFNDLLVSIGDVAAQTAGTLQEMLAGYPQTAPMVKEIKALEHQGDRIVRSMVNELLNTFITPIDREDIYELVKAIDDVIDHIDEGASLFDIYQVEAVTDCVRGQAEILTLATRELAASLRSMEKPSRVEHHWAAIHALEDQGDELLRTGVKEVFAACYDEPAIIICWKDIYSQFEEAIDACERAATVLEAVGVKNS
jgi:predicted phosphate transport protein (TIGR00153 family)